MLFTNYYMNTWAKWMSPHLRWLSGRGKRTSRHFSACGSTSSSVGWLASEAIFLPASIRRCRGPLATGVGSRYQRLEDRMMQSKWRVQTSEWKPCSCVCVRALIGGQSPKTRTGRVSFRLALKQVSEDSDHSGLPPSAALLLLCWHVWNTPLTPFDHFYVIYFLKSNQVEL